MSIYCFDYGTVYHYVVMVIIEVPVTLLLRLYACTFRVYCDYDTLELDLQQSYEFRVDCDYSRVRFTRILCI